MARSSVSKLSRRERQILDIVYQRGEATAEEVRTRLPDPPVNATVRRQLRTLEEKGLLRHRQEGQVFIYRPTVEREEAGRSALKRLVRTFFGGSPAQAAAALLSMSKEELSQAELDELARLIGPDEEGEDV